MRWLFAVVIGGFLSCAAQAELLAPQAFTETFARRLQTAWPDSTVTIRGDLAAHVKGPGGGTNQIFLTNLYAHYRSDPNRLEELIRTFVAGLRRPERDSTTSAALDRTRIIPVIKDRPWLVELNYMGRAQGGQSAPDFAIDDFNEELVVVYAMDDSNRMRFLTTRELAGIERNDLKTLAVANLKRILPKIEMRGDRNLSMMLAGGDYEASLLLFDNIWTSGQIKVSGDIVVAIPARDVLLVTGSQNRAGLKRMRDAIAKMTGGPYRLTDTLFVYRNGQFVKFGKD